MTDQDNKEIIHCNVCGQPIEVTRVGENKVSFDRDVVEIEIEASDGETYVAFICCYPISSMTTGDEVLITKIPLDNTE
jgi:hypothetical protein